MATVKLTLDTRSAKKDGTYPIKLYVSHNGEDFFVTTGVSILAEDWCGVTDKPTKIKKYNSMLNQLLVQAQAHIFKLRADGKLAFMDRKALKNALASNSLEEIKPESKIPAAPIVADLFRDFIAQSKTQGTRSIYTQTLAKLSKYYDVNTLYFTDVTAAWLRNFEDSMLQDGLSVNAISVHMRNFRSVFNRAIDDELISQNNYPFRKFKIKSEKTRKRALTIEQLRVLRDYECQDHQTKYRDIFMLIFYMIGINMIDLLRLEDIKDGRVEFRRAKTKRLYSIALEPEALEIINKYRGKDHLLDVLDTYGNHKDFLHRVNKNLQEIGPCELVANAAKEITHVKKNKKQITPLFPELTTYWARHSWATIAASLEIPKETIAAALGHGGDSVTDIYIDFDRKKVDEANRKVIDFLLQDGAKQYAKG